MTSNQLHLLLADLSQSAKISSKGTLALTKDIPFFSFAGIQTLALCTKVYDGDTVHLVFPYNGKLQKFHCRCLGYNTAELHSKDPTEKAKAEEVRDFVKNKLLGKVIYVKIKEFDKYGRLLSDIKYCENKLSEDVSTLIKNGSGDIQYLDVDNWTSLKDKVLAADLAMPYEGYGEKLF